MERFDKKGMIVIPNPIFHETANSEKLLAAVEAYCPNGHNMINGRAKFSGYSGIVIDVEQDGERGKVALSPIYGDKSRISLDIDLIDGKVLKLFCPVCGVALPPYSECTWCDKGKLIAFFLTPNADFSYCFGVCNMVGCPNAAVIKGGEMVYLHMLKATEA